MDRMKYFLYRQNHKREFNFIKSTNSRKEMDDFIITKQLLMCCTDFQARIFRCLTDNSDWLLIWEDEKIGE